MSGNTLIWQPAAVAGLVRLRADDRQLAKAVRVAVGTLADEPVPADSVSLGRGGVRRLRRGQVRILYEFHDRLRAVHILNVGQGS